MVGLTFTTQQAASVDPLKKKDSNSCVGTFNEKENVTNDSSNGKRQIYQNIAILLLNTINIQEITGLITQSCLITLQIVNNVHSDIYTFIKSENVGI